MNPIYPMKPYEKTTVWVAKIVTDRDDWNTQYETSPWDDVSIYATRDLAMETIWKAILETRDYHMGPGAYSLEPWRDNPEWEEANLWELAEMCFYNEDWLNDGAEDENFPFREELRFDKWPFPRTFYWVTDELEYSLEEMIVHLPPEE
jgi:hypothetical protein